MSSRKSAIERVIITTVGALIGLLFFYLSYPAQANVPPSWTGFAWEIGGASSCVIAGAYLFSWAGKK